MRYVPLSAFFAKTMATWTSRYSLNNHLTANITHNISLSSQLKNKIKKKPQHLLF